MHVLLCTGYSDLIAVLQQIRMNAERQRITQYGGEWSPHYIDCRHGKEDKSDQKGDMLYVACGSKTGNSMDCLSMKWMTIIVSST